MNHKQLLKGLLTLAILICTQVNAWALNHNQPLVQEDVVLQWNRVLMETVLTPGQHPATIMQVRSYAMMHAAIFDAVNAVDGSHTPYLTDVPGSQNASIEAAAAQAAHDVLAALYPTRVAVFDAVLATSLQGIDEYRAQQGIRVGQIVAERMLAADFQFGSHLYSLSFGDAVCDHLRLSVRSETATGVNERAVCG
jgi:hypothetical protein